ncbi:DEAD box helicase, putative [Plasmodium gallinaceum]|uniref:ATP-dependent RNA helicase n=1 Tax=Plasmodium gallinaceum TaxID=5849 RepID=A0A1J1GY88_PLAGA|nr:DEAD box helicase, putative [Plasmodium gallinaceum]CRG97524.1 DEAD box helicase, putative [Plasmodium gallinaceum]
MYLYKYIFMENYIIEFFFLLKFFIFNFSRTKKYYFYKYIIFLFYLKNLLYAKKWENNKKGNFLFLRNINVKKEKILLKNDRNVNNISLLKERYRKGNKNIVFIEKGVNDENKIYYVKDCLNKNVKEIKYISDLQKSFIYLIERNNNMLLHAKTSSGKTTICLFYFILKFYYNCEFIFYEDIEREKYMNNEYFEDSLYGINNYKKPFPKNKLMHIPYSERYSEISDIKENKDILMEKKSNIKLKNEKILILCSSKELCVQISQNILSFINNKNSNIIKLFIDKQCEYNKEGKDIKKEKEKNEEENYNFKVESTEHNQISNPLKKMNKNINSENNEKGTNKRKINENSRSDINNNLKINKELIINNMLKEKNELKNVLFLIGTPICFKNYLLNLEKENLKEFLKSIKYIFFDEIDKLFPSLKKHNLIRSKDNIKKKTAYLILETIMYINKKNLIFIGCSSTLNRELHRKIFKLLSLNRNNSKKKIFLLREKNNLLKTENNRDNNPIKINSFNFDEKTKNKLNENDEKYTKKENTLENNQINEIGESDSNAFDFNNYINNENVFQKYVIKVRIPNSIYHFYYVINNELFENRIKETYKIIEHFSQQKILILIKNGYSLMKMKQILEEKNIFCILLHEKLQISLKENNKHLNKLCSNYEEIKNIKEISTNEKKEFINKFPVIISSFDSIRGFHINNLDIVLLCNKPKNINEYIHLCGRVGRRNKIGYSIMLENEKNINIVKKWLVNIEVNFNNLILNNSSVKQEKVVDEEKTRNKNDLNYLVSNVLEELKEDI